MKAFFKGILLGFLMSIWIGFYMIVFWNAEKELDPQSPKTITSFIIGTILGALFQFVVFITISIIISSK